MEKLNGLDLFSGIGGLSLALEPWVETVAYCERDGYAQQVLLSRMLTGELDAAPIWDDVTTLRARDLPVIDIIFGGFPCQDLSLAGKGAGLTGERSGLFFEIMRLLDETRAPSCFLENVPAIRTRGLPEVVEEFSRRGYRCEWNSLSAAEVGAPHKRDRWFLLATHPDRIELREQQRRSERTSREGPSFPGDDGSQGTLANAHREGQLQQSGPEPVARRRARDSSDEVFGAAYWSTEPNVGRVAHGVPSRMDRLRCLGNAVVPLQARTAFEALSQGVSCERR
jgi:DNA (cytosine-5)-methyltransferase 1